LKADRRVHRDILRMKILAPVKSRSRSNSHSCSSLHIYAAKSDALGAHGLNLCGTCDETPNVELQQERWQPHEPVGKLPNRTERRGLSYF